MIIFACHVVQGKESMPDYLPGVRCTKTEATTLIVTLSDEQSGLEVDLYYVCLHNYNAICRRTVLRNLHNRKYWNNSKTNERINYQYCKITLHFHVMTAAYESRGCCDQDPSIDGILPKTIQRAYSATIDFEVGIFLYLLQINTIQHICACTIKCSMNWPLYYTLCIRRATLLFTSLNLREAGRESVK